MVQQACQTTSVDRIDWLWRTAFQAGVHFTGMSELGIYYREKRPGSNKANLEESLSTLSVNGQITPPSAPNSKRSKYESDHAINVCIPHLADAVEGSQGSGKNHKLHFCFRILVWKKSTDHGTME